MLICLSSSLEKYMINVAYYHYLQKIGGRCLVCHRPKMQIGRALWCCLFVGLGSFIFELSCTQLVWPSN